MQEALGRHRDIFAAGRGRIGFQLFQGGDGGFEGLPLLQFGKASAKRFAYRRLHLVKGSRLQQIIHNHAGFQRRKGALHRRMPGKDDHEQVRPDLLRLLEHRHAVHFRHADIEQHQIVRHAAQLFHGFPAAAGLIHEGIASQPERPADRQQYVRVVVDDEDAGFRKERGGCGSIHGVTCLGNGSWQTGSKW
jgi:hypothetical protein